MPLSEQPQKANNATAYNSAAADVPLSPTGGTSAKRGGDSICYLAQSCCCKLGNRQKNVSLSLLQRVKWTSFVHELIDPFQST